jgi:hypothetical protein
LTGSGRPANKGLVQQAIGRPFVIGLLDKPKKECPPKPPKIVSYSQNKDPAGPGRNGGEQIKIRERCRFVREIKVNLKEAKFNGVNRIMPGEGINPGAAP